VNSLSSRGGSREERGPGRPLFFSKVNFIFFTLYTMSEEIFLQLSFDFIVAEIRGVFGSVWGGGVCARARVCVIP